ncbi:MAG: HRDC domain-containing protein [Saprospiraceae bacterium]
MNLRLFQTRLDDQHIHADQDAINAFMEQVTVKKTATQFVPGEPDYWSVMVFYENGKPKKPAYKEPEKLSVEADVELSADEQEIVSALKQWRRDKALTANLPEYIICHNADLIAVSKLKPRSMEELSRVKGFGDLKVAKYGDDIMSVLNAF